MKYSIGGKINSNGDLLSYFESLDDKLSDIEKRRNIALKLNLDVEGRKEAEDLLEKFDEKSKNGMNNYFVTQAKGVRDLTKAWNKLDLIKNDLEYEEDAAKKASLQNRYDKQVNAIVRQANAYQALGYQVNDNIQKILEFSKAQEAVLQKRTGGQYQYTVQNFKDLFDVMRDLMPLLEKSDGLSKNLFHMSPQLSDVKEIEERAKKAEQYIKNVYEKYGDALLPDETQREVVRNYATTQGYSRVHKRITGQAASYSPEFNEAINNIRLSNSPIEKEIFEQQVLRVESDYENVLTALRKDAQKAAEAVQDDLVLSYENLVNEINESIQNMSQKLDSTKSRISFLELEQQKKLTKEWGSFEGSRPRFSETGDIAGAYITNEAFTEANKLYDSLFEKIEQGAITSDEAINMMAEDLFKAVSKGEATPFLSDDVIKLQEEVDELKAKIVSLSEALQEAKSEAQDFANVANGTYENNLDLENQIDRLLRRIDEQQEEIDNLTRENDYLRDNQGNGYGDGYGDGYGSYSDDYVEGLQSTLQHLTDRIDSLEGLLSSQGGQMGDGQGDGKAPFGECCAILSGIKETLGSINFQGLNAMPEDVTSIRNVLNDIAGSVEGLKDILASSDGQIAVTNVTNLGIGNEDDPEARQRYAELMDAYASVFNPRKTSRSFKDEAGNVVNKISEKISVTFDEIASAIITNLPTVGARYGNNVSAFKEIYSLERIQARPLQDRITLLTDLLGWIKELSKVDLGQELNSVIRKNSKGFPELTSESISNNQLGFANSVEAILKTLQEIARQVGGIFNALNAGATNDIPNFNADYLTDRGQILKDLFSKIATTGKGAISSRASNVANIKDFLNQFNTYGNGEWSLDEFARINDISKKNLEVLKKYNEELFEQKELVEDIADQQEAIQIEAYRGTNEAGFGKLADVGRRPYGGTFYSSSLKSAQEYGDFVEKALLTLRKPLVVEGNGQKWEALDFSETTEEAKELVNNINHQTHAFCDTIIDFFHSLDFSQMSDEFVNRVDEANDRFTSFANFYGGNNIRNIIQDKAKEGVPSQMALADINMHAAPIVSDLYDFGKLIPDDFKEEYEAFFESIRKIRDALIKSTTDLVDLSNNSDVITGFHSADTLSNYAVNKGYDSLWLKNVIDGGNTIADDIVVYDEANIERLGRVFQEEEKIISSLTEEKETHKEINSLIEEKNALEQESAHREENSNLEEEQRDLREVNSLLEEKAVLEKENNSLEEADAVQDNTPITSALEAIKEKTEAFEKEKETVDEVVEAEKQKLKELQDSVGKVTKAVKAKTDAFDKEGKVVVDTMQEEKEAILSLPSVITTPNGEVINPQSRNASSAASFNTPPLLPGGSANADDNPQDQFPEWEKITLRFIKAIESFDNMVEKIPEKIMDEEIHYQDVHGQAYRTRISDVVSGNLNIGGRQISLMDRVDAINAMPNGTASEMQAKLDEMQSLIPVINAYTSSIKEMIKSHGELADSLSMKKIQNRIQDYLSTNTNLATEQRAELLRLKQALEDAFDPQNNNISMTKDEFRELLGNLELAEANIRRTGREGKNVFQKMAEQVGHLNERWIGQLLSFHDIIRYIRTMYTEIKNIDTALIELKKVTDGLTMERLNISLENSLDTARKLGSEVTEVINTTADWARLGYGIEDAEKLAEITTLFKNVGDNMTTDAASEYLISTLKGFEMVPEEALSIVDKFNEVANNFAIDTAGIGTALERSSASFNAANTNLSESIALVTTANAVVQNPESVGTTFKTLSARIRGAKTELEELGEEEDSFTKSTSKLRDLVKGMTGFDIMEDEDTFKSIYDILLGIGEEWDNLTDVERASLGEALAGKRNSNVLFAIMNNIEDLEKAYETAENAAGSATKEQENYQKSIQYSVDVFKAELSELYTKVLNSDDVKKFVDLMAQALSYVVKIADKVPTIAIIGGMFGLSHIAGNSTRMGELGKFLDAVKSATKVLASGGGTQAWKTLSSSLVDIQKVGLKEGQTTPLIQLLSNPSSIASLAKAAGLIAVITTAYIGLAKAIDSAVDSIEDIEKRMDEASGKIQEYDSKLTELYARLDEINSMDMSSYSQTQQQNLQDEAKHVKELANQYENLKIAYEEGYAKDRETLWWGETREVPVVASAEKMLSGDFKGAWETDLASGLYRGDNKLLQFLINKALMTNLVGQFIPDEENNKSENLDKSIKDYEKLVQKIEDARERQIDSLEKVNSGEYDNWTRNYFEKSASKAETELIKLNKERTDIVSNILEDQADLMEMRDSIKSKSPELFTEEDVLTLEWIEKELSKIGVFLDKISEAPDYGKKLASVLVGSEVEYAARSGKTREDLANTWLGQLNEEELTKFGELDLTGVTISSLEELRDLLIETAEATNVLSYSFEGLGALLSSGEMATSSKSWAEVKNDLIGLAQAGKLDENTLREYEYYDTILQELGLSADEADAQISEMIDSINKMAQQNAVDVLNKYKNGVDSLADAYEKYRKGDFIDASTLSAIQDTFGDLDSYHEFEEAVMSGEENLQQYFDNIVTEYAIQESALGELTEANKDWVKQQLIASGITEASADKAIKQSLERKESIEGEIRATLELMNAEVAENSGRKDLIVSTENLDKLTTKEITLLMQEANMSGTAAQAVALFALKKELAKDASLRNQDDINYLLQLINLADIGSAKVSELKYKLEHQQDYENAKKNADALEENFYKTYGKDSTKWNSGARQYWQEVEKARQNADNALKKIDTLSKDVIGEINKQHPELDYTLDLDLDYGGAVDAASEAGSAAAESFKETLDKILAMYDAELDAGVETFKNYVNKSRAIIEQYYQEGKITASEYYDYIANLYEKQVSEYDKVISAVQRKIQEQIDSLDKEKESIEESYNLQIEEIQKKIDALQEENEEIDRNMALSRAQ